MGLVPSTAALAGEAAKPITPYLDLRYRLEVVDQAGLPKDAIASTLRIRAGVRTGEWNGLSAVLEGEAIAPIGADSYNDTVNGKVAYPVVADRSNAVLNQAYARWRPVKQFDLTAGRQAINHDNQRWVGSVNWRQNDQTLDAVRVAAKPLKDFSIDGFYAWRVNRVFGPDSAQGIWHDTSIEGVRAAAVIKGLGTLSAYGYWLDIPASPTSSSQTLGVRFSGEHRLGGNAKLLLSAEYARQSDSGNNPRSFGLDYFLIEPGLIKGGLTLKVGYEQLGGNGVVALQTPLATLHAFNGWADKFLTTPAMGLRDLYADAAYKFGRGPLKGLGLRLAWHDFNSDLGGLDLGQEVDAQISYPLNRKFNLLAKFARYDAGLFASDTTKFWFAIEAKF